MVRVGVIGCGYWGSKHLRVVRGLAVDDIVAIDPVADRCDLAKPWLPAGHRYAALGDALDSIDAVIVATPPTSHFGLALEAIRAGKHVLVEKPLTTSVAEAQQLIREAEAANVTLMVGHTFEFNPTVLMLRDLVTSGDLGDLYYLDAARLNLGLYQPDVNVLWDLAPHDISIANFVLGDLPDVVHAWAARHAHPTLEDVAFLRLEYQASGVIAQIHVSWLDPCKVRRVTVVGSQKMAVYNDLNDETRLRIFDKGVKNGGCTCGSCHGDLPVSYRYGDVVAPYVAFEEPLVAEDRHFLECIASGMRPRSDGRDGLGVISVLEAAATSLRTGAPAQVLHDMSVGAA